jgi:hypothetical protein
MLRQPVERGNPHGGYGQFVQMHAHSTMEEILAESEECREPSWPHSKFVPVSPQARDLFHV